MKQPHIQLEAAMGFEYAIMPGDPARLDRIAELLENPIEMACNREFRSLAGMDRHMAFRAGNTPAADRVGHFGHTDAAAVVGETPGRIDGDRHIRWLAAVISAPHQNQTAAEMIRIAQIQDALRAENRKIRIFRHDDRQSLDRFGGAAVIDHSVRIADRIKNTGMLVDDAEITHMGQIVRLTAVFLDQRLEIILRHIKRTSFIGFAKDYSPMN